MNLDISSITKAKIFIHMFTLTTSKSTRCKMNLIQIKQIIQAYSKYCYEKENTYIKIFPFMNKSSNICTNFNIIVKATMTHASNSK